MTIESPRPARQQARAEERMNPFSAFPDDLFEDWFGHGFGEWASLGRDAEDERSARAAFQGGGSPQRS